MAGRQITQDVDRVLIDTHEIARRVQQMGATISEDYRNKDPVLMVTLKGAVVFVADLMRNIDIPVCVDFVRASSYGDSTESSQDVVVQLDTSGELSNRHVLIIEDIVDTGRTLSALIDEIHSRAPASVKVCCLLDKSARRTMDVPLDYVGFQVPDEFVVGYGLDFAQRYRNLPYVAVLKPQVYQEQ